MRITVINVYQVDLPLKEGRYSWSEGKYVEVFDCTVVEIETDEGVAGYGEVCPLGAVLSAGLMDQVCAPAWPNWHHT